MARTILILGGAGFLGSVLTEKLRSLFERIVVVDQYYFQESGKPSNIANIEYKKADVRNLSLADFESANVVVDLAAISNDPAAERFCKQTININVCSRLRNVELARNAGVSQYILASSCSVYGKTSTTAPDRLKRGCELSR